ncbi:MAG: DUF4474 domain-containing protein [Bacilli bacterium]|nr:DUF4474 domain-containing protein [Bacilli bacterium]
MFYIIFSILIFFFIVLFILFTLRKKWAIRKVKCTSDEEKLLYVNAMLEPFGFIFDECQDIIISKKDCWQRDMGYADIYDFKAPFFNMVMDSLPICFNYDNKEYRIEFWKGQYGITTGAEIGIYFRDKTDILGCYHAVSNEDCLEISFDLLKNCPLFSRCDKTWWLTGFDLGVFSRPRDLRMDICLRFKSEEMLQCFVKSLINAGIPCSHINICENQVCFDYCCVNNYKPNHSYAIVKFVMQICNFINCRLYRFITRYFNRTLDKLTYLRYLAPCLYRLVIRISLPRPKRLKVKKNKRK